MTWIYAVYGSVTFEAFMVPYMTMLFLAMSMGVGALLISDRAFAYSFCRLDSIPALLRLPILLLALLGSLAIIAVPFTFVVLVQLFILTGELGSWGAAFLGAGFNVFVWVLAVRLTFFETFSRLSNRAASS